MTSSVAAGVRFPSWARLCGIAAAWTLAVVLSAQAVGPAASQAVSTPASAAFDSDENGYKVQVVDIKDPVARQYTATMPSENTDGWKLRLLLENIYDPSKDKAFDHPRSMVPLNPAGQKHGEEQFRVPYDSTVYHTVPWKNGLKDGMEKVFRKSRGETPSIEYEIPWKDGNIHGVKKSYFPDGSVMAEAGYAHGNLEGESTLYTRQGILERKSVFSGGKRDGPSVDYWASGHIKRTTPYKAGLVEGLVKEFYDSGQLKREMPFKNNVQHGVEKQYGADGQLEKTKHWIDGQEVPEAEFKDKFKP